MSEYRWSWVRTCHSEAQATECVASLARQGVMAQWQLENGKYEVYVRQEITQPSVPLIWETKE